MIRKSIALKKKSIALIPARKHSKRIKDKNILNFYGHPLLAYSIVSAINSNLFSKVICVTDSSEYAEIAEFYGAEIPGLRPKKNSKDVSPDIEWVKWVINEVNINKKFKIFSILRPTSPFRTSKTIKRAYNSFINHKNADSLRAVEICKQHPGKMWVYNGEYIFPIFSLQNKDQPFHSSQFASLPKVYVQNASLEIAWIDTIYKTNSIAGEKIIPFFTNETEGIDINNYDDLNLIDSLVSKGSLNIQKLNHQSWFA